MTEQEDVLQDLDGAGVTSAVRWAVSVAYRRLLEDFEGEAAYDQTWIGLTAHKLVCDRLDRVFGCGAYEHPDGEVDGGLDVLRAGLLPAEIRDMPQVPVGRVIRDDLNGSPGWRLGQWRWLLTSSVYGQVSKLNWAAKRPTKQRVAMQPPPDQLTLPEDVLSFAVPDDGTSPPEVGPRTLVVAHAVDVYSHRTQTYLGRSRYNADGGPPWHWLVPLGAAALAAVDTSESVSAEARTYVDDVDDAPVRLRDVPLTDSTAAEDGEE
jgi:hypothetical protein